MDNATPVKRSFSTCDLTLIDTPQPQASSTVNRKDGNTCLVTPISRLPCRLEDENNSPSHLSNAIFRMRELSDQLEIIPGLHESRSSMLITSVDQPIRRSYSAMAFFDGKRESVATESEANSSLGILKLDNDQGFSEPEDTSKSSMVFAQLRSEHGQNVMDSQCPMPTSHKTQEGYLLFEDSGKVSQSRQLPTSLNDTALSHSTTSSSNSINADLRLRLQKVLAQRTLDRSVDFSLRASPSAKDQVISSKLSSGHKFENGVSLGGSSQWTAAFSYCEDRSFGSGQFVQGFGGRQSTRNSISSESFQPAEAAAARMERDEKSWHKHFGDFPVETVQEAAVQTPLISESQPIQNLTQNLEISAFSGVMNGDVTVSVLEDDGKRHMSMGEYFGLRTEKLGSAGDAEQDSERPNFGKVIKSPPRCRPHPPLIDISASQVSSYLDEAPTRDAGLNADRKSSSDDSSLGFPDMSECGGINLKDQQLLSKSCDLMPPPPARASLSKTISSSKKGAAVSLVSLPVNESCNTNVDDASHQKSGVASISQVANLLSDMSGSISTKDLVDNIMKGLDAHMKKSGVQGAPSTISCSAPVTVDGNEESKALRPQNLNRNTVDDKVTDWMSSLEWNRSSSPFENDSTTNRYHSLSSLNSEDCYSVAKGREVRSVENLYRKHREIVRKALPQRRSSPTSSYDGNESYLSSCGIQENEVLPQEILRPHSTPKVNSRTCKESATERRTDYVSSSNRRQSSLERKSLPSSVGGSYTVGRVSHNGVQEAMTSESNLRDGSKFASDELLQGLSLHPGKSTSSGDKNRNSAKHSQQVHQKDDSYQILDLQQLKDPVLTTSPQESGMSRAGSACSATKSSSRHTDSSSTSSAPLLLESTHAQLSWASVPVGSSVMQTFALRNRSHHRLRLHVLSSLQTFKLMGVRGESLSELIITLHPEETRRIHIVFCPTDNGPVVGRLTISRLHLSEPSSACGDRRLIPLYAFGGTAVLSVDGASKDRWSELFLSMDFANEELSMMSDGNPNIEVHQMVASFSIQNSGSVSAFVNLQVVTELPFEDCGVIVCPSHMSLTPGQSEHIKVRFQPGHDILLCLNKKVEDMLLLANLKLSWSELATWQRIRRVSLKYKEELGWLSKLGPLYTGDLGVAHELKDKKPAEIILAQAVHCTKVAVLVERRKLSLFDLDTTLVFQQLLDNESSWLCSPPDAVRTVDTPCIKDSPVLGGNLDCLSVNHPGAFQSNSFSNNLIIVTNISPQCADLRVLRFPRTICSHKSSVKVRFVNPSTQPCTVTVYGATQPFSVSSLYFPVQGTSYFVLRILFRPLDVGIYECNINVSVDGKIVRSYQLEGEGMRE